MLFGCLPTFKMAPQLTGQFWTDNGYMKLTMAEDIQNYAITFPENLAPSVFNIYQTLINDANNHKKLRARHENDLIRIQ